MRRICILGVAAGSAMLLAACAGDPTVNREAQVELAPMAKPAPTAPLPYMDGDTKVMTELVSLQDDLATYKMIGGKDDGCSYSNKDWFGPSLTYENCGGESGSQQYTKDGDIWPLAVGKTEKYAVKGSNGKDTWETTRRCEVRSTVAVVIGEKQLPSYEVVCTDKWNTRTWYVSPELGQTVKYKRYSNSRGVVADHVAVLSE